MLPITSSLATLCSSAVDELVLVAPFIKYRVLNELLQHTHTSVTVQVVTRWLPQDVRVGVTDVEVWDVMKSRPKGSLWICDDLHAKYYRADESILVGSANLTAAALGLTDSPNLELLVSARADCRDLEGFEKMLLQQAVRVNDEIADLTRRAASLLPVPFFIPTSNATHFGDSFESFSAHQRQRNRWIPLLRQPEDLYIAYLGRSEELTSTARRCALADLEMLDIPLGLNGKGFKIVVGAALLRFPAIAAVAAFITEPRRFGEVRQFMSSKMEAQDTASRDWQVVLRWLLYFLDDRFEYGRPNFSEIIARRPEQVRSANEH